NAGSEAAFGELVNRHVNLVYSTALGAINRDEHLAFDVSQSVFADLARKANELCRRGPRQVSEEASDPSSPTGWLYTNTRFAPSKAVRAEQTRRQYEQKAETMRTVLQSDSREPDWAALRPLLEEAIGKLADPERDAILLRFYEEKDLRTVGAV